MSVEKPEKEESLPPLTQRELAIARDEDPDEIQEETAQVEESSEEQEVEEAPEEEQQEETTTVEEEQVPEEKAPEEPEVVAEKPESETDASVEDEPWLQKGDVELANSFGIAQEDLESLASREEYDRLISIMTRNDLAAASRFRQSQQQLQSETQARPGQLPPGANENQQAQPPTTEQAEQLPGIGADGKVDVKYYEDGNFDEATISVVKALRAQQDQFSEQKQTFDNFLEYQALREQEEQFSKFHDAVDAYRPDFFGQTIDENGQPVEISSELADRRAKLGGAVLEIEQIIKQQNAAKGVNTPIPDYSVLVRRAAQLEFADELREFDLKEQSEKLAAQSKKRRPVSRSVGAKVATPLNKDDMTTEDIANLPEVTDFWRKAQEENGATV